MKLLASFLLCSICTFAPLHAQARIDGTFVQLTASQGEWPTEKWRQLFDYFHTLGITQIVVQWSVYDDLAFFPSSSFQAVPNPPLSTILQLANESGIKVWVGGPADSTYWSEIAKQPDQVDEYLRRCAERSTRTIVELQDMLAHAPAFQGWYFAEEIDDTTWLDPAKRNALLIYLQAVSQAARKSFRNLPLAISTFSGGNSTAEGFASFWKELLAASDLDVVFFQDGVGAKKLTSDSSPLYAAALSRVVSDASRKMDVVVELFNQISERPFRAEAAAWNRVQHQVEHASHFSSDGIMSFSVPDYMTPWAGAAGSNLYFAYLYHRKLESPPADLPGH